MYYIRIGYIPNDEHSKIYYHGKEIIGIERGVSVYNCAKIKNKYYICVPNPTSECAIDTIHGLLLDVCHFKSRKAYLVSGNVIGIGRDSEIILKNIKIIKDITEEFKYIKS
jgi:hypothetical protein